MITQGFDFHVDLMRTVLWQYEGAPNIISMARNDQAFIDGAFSGFWSAWIRDVFDLTTANAFGLSVWARILDYSIALDDGAAPPEQWGFGPDDSNFENAGFGKSTGYRALSIDDARAVLLLRWFRLTMRPTVPNINTALEHVFGPGAAVVVDNGDMTMTYFFFSQPANNMRDLLNNTDALPRPAGVLVTWQVQPREAWGYGAAHLNYEQGNFGA